MVTSFSTVSSLGLWQVKRILIQPDGKLLVFNVGNSPSNSGVFRLDTLGNKDTTFYRSSGGGYCMALNNNGTIVVAGPFTSYNGTACNQIVRLKSNGYVDSSFTAIVPDNQPFCALSYNDGVILGGNFGYVNGNYYSGDLVYLDRTSALNNSMFNYGTGPQHLNLAVAQGSEVLAIYNDTVNHRFLLGGIYNSFNGYVVSNFSGHVGVVTHVGIDSVSIQTPVCASGTPKVNFKNEIAFNAGNVFTVQLSDSGGSFTSAKNIGTQSGTSLGWDSLTASIPSTTINGVHYKIRVVATNPVDTSTISGSFVIGPNLDTITAGSTTTFCVGGSVTLSSKAENTYLWSNGATTQNVSITSSGTYLVSVTANGCTAVSNSIIVTANSNPAAPTITPSDSSGTTYNDGIICNGAHVSLQSSASTSYAWSTGATTQTLSGLTPSSNTTYSVTITNANGCTASASSTVTVNALPTASATSNSPVCVGQALTLTGRASGLTSYAWSGPSSFSSSSQSPTVNSSATSAMAGTYSITVMNSNGCTASANIAVIINALPSATAVSNSPLCSGQTLSLTGGSSGLSSYAWTGPSSFSSTNQNPIVNGNATSAMAGTYTITVTNGNGCTASANTSVTVNANPAAPTITPSDSSGLAYNDGIICSGASASLQSSGAIAYLWSTGTTTQTLSGLTLSSNTTYSVTITDGNRCQNSNNYTVIVTPLPNNLTVTAQADTICSGSSTNIILSATQTGKRYDLRTGTSIISSDYGNGSSLNLNTGNLRSATTFNVLATDTSTDCDLPMSSSVTINIAPTPEFPLFTAGDTILCAGATSCYQASASNSQSVYYAIESGGASIDSIQGCVMNVTSSFMVMAIAVGFWDCMADTSYMYVRVPFIGLPTTPASQSTCSDEALTFVFNDTAGTGANEIEWALNSNFFVSQIVATPANITITIGPGPNQAVWMRSKDSITGCVSNQVNTFVSVNLIPASAVPTVSVDTVCPNGAGSILIPNSQMGKNYQLSAGSSILNSDYGNGNILALGTGAISTTTNFSLFITDTLTGCSVQQTSVATINVASAVSAPLFTAGDTILYYGESSQYAVINFGSSQVYYFIDSGNAVIDSVSGWVTSVNSNFIVEAITVGYSGCSVADAYLPVTYSPNPAPPIPPAPQSAWSDSNTSVTFTLTNVSAGRGGNQIEWATNPSFTGSQVFTSPGTITVSVMAGNTTYIWLRSKNQTLGTISPFIFTYLENYMKKGAPVGSSTTAVEYVTLSSGTIPGLQTTGIVGRTPGYNGTTPYGGMTYTIPIACPPGVKNIAPQIALSYNSQGGNGPMGWGWSIAGLSSISRSGFDNFHNGKVGPVTCMSNPDGTGTIDPFNIDGLRLTPNNGENGAAGISYYKEVEDYSTINSESSFGKGPEWFQVVTKQGITMEYGNTIDSKLLSADGSNVLQWRVNKVYDQDGNYMTFQYDNAEGGCRISQISYTGNSTQGTAAYCTMLFAYNTRFDINTTFSAGTPFSNQNLLSSITITNANGTSNNFKQYNLAYTQDNLSSYLYSVTETGTDGLALNPTIFKYGSSPNLNSYNVTSSNFDDNWKNLSQYNSYFNTASASLSAMSGDFNGDGYSDILTIYQMQSNNSRIDTGMTPYNLAFQVNIMDPTTNNFYNLPEVDKDPDDPAFIPCYDDGTQDLPTDHENYSYHVGDFLGLGKDGILEIQRICVDNAYLAIGTIKYYTLNTEGHLTSTSWTSPANPTPAGSGFISIGDFDGDGILDYILYSGPFGTTGYASFPGKGIFNKPITMPANFSCSFYWTTLPYYNSYNFESYVIDFDGDGKKDMMYMTAESTYVYTFSTSGCAAFASGTAATSSSDCTLQFNTLAAQLSYPTLNTNDQIYLGDFNGDGKTDILTHVKSGYWDFNKHYSSFQLYAKS